MTPPTDCSYRTLYCAVPQTRTLLVVLCVLFLVTVGSRAQSGPLKGGWTARSTTGRTLKGTWTATADPKTGAVTGTWTLDDAKGTTVASGGWSAAKSPTGWSGAWRSVVSGSKVEYSGTWDAAVKLKADAPFALLFATAIKDVVSGTWRSGRHSGAWSIRVF